MIFSKRLRCILQARFEPRWLDPESLGEPENQS
jgi:hypothetical protein